MSRLFFGVLRLLSPQFSTFFRKLRFLSIFQQTKRSCHKIHFATAPFSSESGGKVNKSGGGENGAYVIGSELDAAKKVAQLPTSMQARYNDLPKVAQRALVK